MLEFEREDSVDYWERIKYGVLYVTRHCRDLKYTDSACSVSTDAADLATSDPDRSVQPTVILAPLLSTF